MKVGDARTGRHPSVLIRPIAAPECRIRVSVSSLGVSYVKKLLLLCSAAVICADRRLRPVHRYGDTEEEDDRRHRHPHPGRRRHQSFPTRPRPRRPDHAGTDRTPAARASRSSTRSTSFPGVNFTNTDPYGSSGGNLRIRGFDGNRISLTFDGIPLNDSGNYAIFSNQQLDPELIEQVNVNLGVDRRRLPDRLGGRRHRQLSHAHPAQRLRRSRRRLDRRRSTIAAVRHGRHRRVGPWGTRPSSRPATPSNDKFNGPGEIDKQQFNARIYQPLGNNGDFISIAGHYNQNRNNFYRNPSVTDLRTRLRLDAEIPDAVADRRQPVESAITIDDAVGHVRSTISHLQTAHSATRRRAEPSDGDPTLRQSRRPQQSATAELHQLLQASASTRRTPATSAASRASRSRQPDPDGRSELPVCARQRRRHDHPGRERVARAQGRQSGQRRASTSTATATSATPSASTRRTTPTPTATA